MLNLLFTSEQHLSNTILVFLPCLAIALINRAKDVLELGGVGYMGSRTVLRRHRSKSGGETTQGPQRTEVKGQVGTENL